MWLPRHFEQPSGAPLGSLELFLFFFFTTLCLFFFTPVFASGLQSSLWMLRAFVASMSLLATSSMFGLTATIANVGGLGAGVGAGVGGVGAGVGAVSVPASCGGAGNASKDGGGDDD